jgi:hypothetical protein
MASWEQSPSQWSDSWRTESSRKRLGLKIDNEPVAAAKRFSVRTVAWL